MFETIKEYVVNWNDHMTTFWTPLIIGLIFLGLAIHSIVRKNVPLVILYIVLVGICVCYMGYSDWVIQHVEMIIKKFK